LGIGATAQMRASGVTAKPNWLKAFMLLYETAGLSIISFFIVRGLIPQLRSRRGAFLYSAVVLSVYFPWILQHALHAPLYRFVAITAGTWIFTCLVWIVFGLPGLTIIGSVKWLRRLLTLRREHAPESIDEGRRQILGNLAFPALSISLGAWGSVSGSSEFVIKKVELAIRNWPRPLDGFRIGQITDTHVGDFVPVRTIIRAVDVLNQARVHLQVMTGDLIDDLYFLEPTFDALERCRAPYGMLAVLGNHEKMRLRLGPILNAYAARRKHGLVRLLVDESEVIHHKGTPLRVIGVDYPMRKNAHHSLRRSERLALMKESAERAFGALPADHAARLCLSHHPEFFPFASKHRVSATISGHTHGGQVALFGQPLIPIYDYMLGRYTLGDSHLYVSGGTGHWWPYRVGVPPEVTVITIRSAV
jgi:uncharacterized protein